MPLFVAFLRVFLLMTQTFGCVEAFFRGAGLCEWLMEIGIPGLRSSKIEDEVYDCTCETCFVLEPPAFEISRSWVVVKSRLSDVGYDNRTSDAHRGIGMVMIW